MNPEIMKTMSEMQSQMSAMMDMMKKMSSMMGIDKEADMGEKGMGGGSTSLEGAFGNKGKM